MSFVITVADLDIGLKAGPTKSIKDNEYYDLA